MSVARVVNIQVASVSLHGDSSMARKQSFQSKIRVETESQCKASLTTLLRVKFDSLRI